MFLEFCAENLTHIQSAINLGVDRIELCDNLASGGTTPSIGVIRQAQAICSEQNIELAVMIRPRGGNFCYSQEELAVMRYDIEQAIEHGVKQIVFSCLTEGNHVDTEARQFLIEGLEDVDVTFHMAFDQIDPSEKLHALDQLIELGVKRILMHGTNKNKSVIENKNEINSYIAYLAGRIEVMVGGGVTAENLTEVSGNIHTNIFHGTKIV